MPPGLGEVAEEKVLPRGGLEGGALGSCELDPMKVAASWLFMRAECVGRRRWIFGGGGGWGGEVRGGNGRLGEVWLKESQWLKRDVKASPGPPFHLEKHNLKNRSLKSVSKIASFICIPLPSSWESSLPLSPFTLLPHPPPPETTGLAWACSS